MRTMNDLSLHFLQDVYDAERRALRSMQKMSRTASSDVLKQAFTRHREQSEEQVSRLEQVFEHVTGKRPRGKTCAAMVGLLKEVDEAIDEGEKGPVLDAALIACAQAIDHYEIARYGAMVAWAHQAGHDEVAELLQANLDEEKQSDHELSELAEGSTNPKAAAVSGPDDEADVAPKPRRGRPPGSGVKAGAKPLPAKVSTAKAASTPAKAAARPAKATTVSAKVAPPKTAVSTRGRPKAAVAAAVARPRGRPSTRGR